MATVYEQILSNIRRFKINEALQQIFNSDVVREWIIDTVHDRLRRTGKDRFMDKIRTDTARKGFTNFGAYSTRTERERQKAGKQFSHVDLFDKGDFFDSWKINAMKTKIKWSADFMKGNQHIGENFEIQYGNLNAFEESILMLSTDEFEILLNVFIIPRMAQYIKNSVYKFS